MKVPIWIAVSLWTAAVVLICGTITLSWTTTQWRAGVEGMWVRASSELQARITQAIREDIGFVKLVASAISDVEPLLQSQSVPNSGYDPIQLIRLFNGLTDESGRLSNSLGFMRRQSPTTNGKLSWQIAKNFGCEPYMYAYADASIYPLFYGYCASENGRVDRTTLAYNGTDWGLKPEEAAMLSGSRPATFLPVFPLLGKFMLTYELAYPVAPAVPYAVTFAEFSLDVFTKFVANLTVIEGRGSVYIVDLADGALLASNVPGSVLSNTGDRLFAANSSFPVIRETYPVALRAINNSGTPLLTDGMAGSWKVSADRYVEAAGINWLIVVAVPSDAVVGNLYSSIIIVSVVCAIILVLLSGATFVVAYAYIQRPLGRLNQRMKQGDGSAQATTEETKGLFSFREVEELTEQYDSMERRRNSSSTAK
jgi:hypothetical protein